jgi:hypothetical protein
MRLRVGIDPGRVGDQQHSRYTSAQFPTKISQTEASGRKTFCMPASLIEELPGRIERALRTLLSEGEVVHVKLRGAFTEALVCTDRRVLIVKGGFMTGQIFGTNAFQLPYSNVAGVEVKFHLLTGYFEVSAGGMQNLPKPSYWSLPSFINSSSIEQQRNFSVKDLAAE